VPDGDTLLAGTFGSANGLDEEHLQLIAKLATPQPYATMTSPVRLAHSRPPGVRRAAIFCADGGMTLAQLRALLAQGDPRASMFADPDWELHELPTGHWAMLSAPAALSQLLHRISLD
jgi:hypothetical protein